MDCYGILEVMETAVKIVATATVDGYEVVRPYLHTGAQALADLLAK